MTRFPPLEDSTSVFRAIGYKEWIKNGVIKWQAFKRSIRDTDGVSVAFTPEAADNQMANPIFGMAEVSVGRTRVISHGNLTLDIIQDEEAHANIVNIPYIHNLTGDDREKQEAIAEFLCKEIIKKAARPIEYSSAKKQS
jgi:hypothetical protein